MKKLLLAGVGWAVLAGMASAQTLTQLPTTQPVSGQSAPGAQIPASEPPLFLGLTNGSPGVKEGWYGILLGGSYPANAAGAAVFDFGDAATPCPLHQGVTTATVCSLDIFVGGGTVAATQSGLWTVGATQADVQSTGSISGSTANAAVIVPVANGQAVVAFTVSGLTASGATLAGQISDDGTTYTAANIIGAGGAPLATITKDGQYLIRAAGHRDVELIETIAGTTGTITITTNASIAPSLITDPNNAPFTTAPALTTTAAAAGRSVDAECTGGGTVVLTLSGGGTINWIVAAGSQTKPYAVTAYVTAPAGCTLYNLN